MLGSELIPESEVTQETLVNLFKQSFFKISFTENKDLVVHTDGPHVLFELNNQLKTLKFMAAYSLKPNISVTDKLALVNTMNDEMNLVRFVIPKANPDFMVADYTLSYDEGISPYLIVTSVRLFAGATSYAIRHFDTQELVIRRD